MGLIRIASDTVRGTISDQWLDFFHLEAMPENVLMAKGQKRKDAKLINWGNDNIISNGSGIAINKGQCIMIVEQGRVMDVCAEPGLYTWNQSSEPSIFAGELGSTVVNTLKTFGRRFAHGGGTGKEQRVYYFNIKELVNNKFGTATPVPFRVVDTNIGLDADISLRCNGVYSYKIADPLLFYTNVSGNVENEYTRDMIDSQLKSEFLSALQPAFASMSAMGLRYSAIPGHTQELCQALNAALSQKWEELRGLQVVSVAINAFSASKEDEDMIKQLQRTAVMRDPKMAGATLINAQAEAMRTAAANEGGAMTGFLGLNMAQQAGNMAQLGHAAMFPDSGNAPTSRSLHDWSCSCGISNSGRFCSDCGNPNPSGDKWSCDCSAVNSGKFCTGCGKPKPEDSAWTCVCGVVNGGRFCSECGIPKP